MRRQIVSLDRTFVDVQERDDDADRINALLLSGLEKPQHWSDIHQHPCVVVLGEAGIGKTTEFREQVFQLRSKGELAFFLTVEDLAQRGLEQSLRDERAAVGAEPLARGA